MPCRRTGDRFAVLRENAIEIYNLPPTAPETAANAGKPLVTNFADLEVRIEARTCIV